MDRVFARISSVAVVVLLSLAAILSHPSPARAGENDHAADTLLLFSTDDWQKLRQGWRDSNAGQFLQDAEIQAVCERVMAGLGEMLEYAKKEAAPPAAAPPGDPKQQRPAEGAGGESGEAKALGAVGEFLTFAKEYCGSFVQGAEGHLSIALAVSQTAGAPKVDLVVHFQGPEEFHVLHERYLSLLERVAPWQPKRVACEIAGVSFAEVPAPPKQGGVAEGLYIGHEGKDYYVGINKSSLLAYIESKKSKTPLPDRLGGSAGFSAVRGALGERDFLAYVNLQPLWTLVRKLIDERMDREDASPVNLKRLLEEIGLFDFAGFAGAGKFSAEGTRGNGVFMIEPLRGIFSLLPPKEKSVELPSFIPAEVLSANVLALNLDRVPELVYSIAEKLKGPEMAQELRENVRHESELMGFSIEEFAQNLEGTVAVFVPSLPGGGAGFGMAALSSPESMPCVALRLKDPAKLVHVLDTIDKHEELGEFLQSRPYQGKTLYFCSLPGMFLASDFDREFPPPPPPAKEPVAEPGVNKPDGEQTPDPADTSLPAEFGGGSGFILAIERDWAICSFSGKALKSAFAAADAAGGSTSLVASARYQEARKMLPGGGMAVGYSDVAASLQQMVGVIRMVYAFLPLAVPKLAGMPGSDKLFHPGNLPSDELIRRHFGVSVTTTRLFDHGVRSESFERNMPRPKPEEKPKSQ